jgi:hypothetical protein
LWFAAADFFFSTGCCEITTRLECALTVLVRAALSQTLSAIGFLETALKDCASGTVVGTGFAFI